MSTVAAEFASNFNIVFMVILTLMQRIGTESILCICVNFQNANADYDAKCEQASTKQIFCRKVTCFNFLHLLDHSIKTEFKTDTTLKTNRTEKTKYCGKVIKCLLLGYRSCCASRLQRLK